MNHFGRAALADRHLQSRQHQLRAQVVGHRPAHDAVAPSIDDHGLPEYKHAYGHNVGRVAHDGSTTLAPRWDRYGNSPYGKVEGGNIYAVELGAEVPGKGWVYLEENVLATEDGIEWLSNPQTDIWLVGGK